MTLRRTPPHTAEQFPLVHDELALDEARRSISPELVLVTPELRASLLLADDADRADGAARDDGFSTSHDAPTAADARAATARRLRPRRVARAALLAACFFAGCALSAGAGEKVHELVEDPVPAAADPSEDANAGEPDRDDRAPLRREVDEAQTGEGKPEKEETLEEPEGVDEELDEVDPVEEQPDAETDELSDDEPENDEPPREDEEESTADPSGHEDEGESSAATAAAGTRAGAAATPNATERTRATAGKRKRARARSGEERGRSGRRTSAVPRALPPVRLAPEVTLPGARIAPLPDPTPRSRRLSIGFARLVNVAAREARADWALVLAALRTLSPERYGTLEPARVKRIARRVAAHPAPRRALTEVVGRPHAERALALADYNRAVGLEALVSGLRAAKRLLAARVATDPRVTVYDAGRKDVIAGRLDVRVLAVILYLAERHGQVTISSLITGHRTYSRPGVVSAHVPGRALDVSAIGGVSVFGNQRPGGVVWRAVRGLLLLPTEVQAQQVISLFDLGGASFALADHADHVHVGFGGIPERGWDWLRDLWQRAGARHGVPWRVLGAINKIESDFGRNMGPSSAGAVGWMQFMPATWEQWGTDADGSGVADPWDPDDAVFSAARYLEASGARSDLPRAVYAYNHADWYVRDVLTTASQLP